MSPVVASYVPSIRVRRGAASDAPAVAACLETAFRAYEPLYTTGAYRDTVPRARDLRRRFAEMVVLVAERTDPANGAAEQPLIGTVAYRVVTPGEGHLRGMAVVPDLQGSGVATLLLEAAEAELHALDCVRVTLDTTAVLERALRFYARHGYAPTGRTQDFYGMPLLELAKQLGAEVSKGLG